MDDKMQAWTQWYAAQGYQPLQTDTTVNPATGAYPVGGQFYGAAPTNTSMPEMWGDYSSQQYNVLQQQQWQMWHQYQQWQQHYGHMYSDNYNTVAATDAKPSQKSIPPSPPLETKAPDVKTDVVRKNREDATLESVQAKARERHVLDQSNIQGRATNTDKGQENTTNNSNITDSSMPVGTNLNLLSVPPPPLQSPAISSVSSPPPPPPLPVSSPPPLPVAPLPLVSLTTTPSLSVPPPPLARPPLARPLLPRPLLPRPPQSRPPPSVMSLPTWSVPPPQSMSVPPPQSVPPLLSWSVPPPSLLSLPPPPPMSQPPPIPSLSSNMKNDGKLSSGPGYNRYSSGKRPFGSDFSLHPVENFSGDGKSKKSRSDNFRTRGRIESFAGHTSTSNDRSLGNFKKFAAKDTDHPPSKDNLEQLSETEEAFNIQFKQWDEQFKEWKEKNTSRQCQERATNLESWRKELLHRWEKMKNKLESTSNNTTEVSSSTIGKSQFHQSTSSTGIFPSHSRTNLTARDLKDPLVQDEIHLTQGGPFKGSCDSHLDKKTMQEGLRSVSVDLSKQKKNQKMIQGEFEMMAQPPNIYPVSENDRSGIEQSQNQDSSMLFKDPVKNQPRTIGHATTSLITEHNSNAPSIATAKDLLCGRQWQPSQEVVQMKSLDQPNDIRADSNKKENCGDDESQELVEQKPTEETDQYQVSNKTTEDRDLSVYDVDERVNNGNTSEETKTDDIHILKLGQDTSENKPDLEHVGEEHGQAVPKESKTDVDERVDNMSKGVNGELIQNSTRVEQKPIQMVSKNENLTQEGGDFPGCKKEHIEDEEKDDVNLSQDSVKNSSIGMPSKLESLKNNSETKTKDLPEQPTNHSQQMRQTRPTALLPDPVPLLGNSNTRMSQKSSNSHMLDMTEFGSLKEGPHSTGNLVRGPQGLKPFNSLLGLGPYNSNIEGNRLNNVFSYNQALMNVPSLGDMEFGNLQKFGNKAPSNQHSFRNQVRFDKRDQNFDRKDLQPKIHSSGSNFQSFFGPNNQVSQFGSNNQVPGNTQGFDPYRGSPWKNSQDNKLRPWQKSGVSNLGKGGALSGSRNEFQRPQSLLGASPASQGGFARFKDKETFQQMSGNRMRPQK